MNEKKSLQEIVEKVAENTGITKKLSDSFFKALVEIIEEALKKDGIAKVKYIGTFKVIAIEERKSVNVQDGTELIIPAHKKISFTPEKTLKDDVNKPYAHLETYVLKDEGPVDGPFVDEETDEDETDDFTETQNTVAISDSEVNTPITSGIAEIPAVSVDSNEAPDIKESVQSEETIVMPADSSKTEDEKTTENAISEEEKSVDNEEIVSTPTIEIPEIEEATSNATSTESINVAEEKAEDAESENNSITDTTATDAAVEINSIETNNNTSDNTEKTSNDMENNNEETVKVTPTDQTMEETTTTANTNPSEEKQEKKETKETKKSSPKNEEKKNEEKDNSKWWLWLLIAVALIIAILFGVKHFMDNKQQDPSPAVPEVSNTVGEEDANMTESDPFFPEEEDQPVDMFEHPEAYVPAAEAEDDATTVSTESTPVTSGRTHTFDNQLVEYMNKKHPELNFPSTVNVKNDYTVIEGSRLAQISRNIYDGVFNYWVYIYYFNTDVLSGPNAVKTGMVLKVPDLGDEFVDTKSEKCKALATEIQGALLK